jgi:fructose-bisphosphate aldolase class I
MQKMKTQPGFVAALDQSGGSTPHALALYGIKDHAWKDDDEMFDLVHQMRTRVITSPSFTGERIVGAILFEDTMDREIGGQPSADYLWEVKRIVPFLKVDKGLQPETDGVQRMKPMPELAGLLDKARTKRIFGTKMRSVIQRASPAGIQTIVQQQFEVADRILNAGLVPIIEPEVDIHCPQKASAEVMLKQAVLEKLNELPAGQQVLLKLTLPEEADFYADFVRHPKVVRVLALSGGYTQEVADARLRQNHGVIASFSRALLEGLSVQQTDAQFNATLAASIRRIYEASIT